MKTNIKDFCKSFFLSKIFIAAISILIGAVAVLIVQNMARSKTNNIEKVMLNQQRDIAEFNRNLFPDNSAIFAEMEAMEKRMNDIFKANHEHMKAVFDQANKGNVQMNRAAISTKEDNNFYYYELNFSGFNKQDIVVGIKDNILTFLAQSKKENKDKKQKSESSSNFHYSFLVPEYDLKKDPEIIREENKITVKLSKKISEKNKKVSS